MSNAKEILVVCTGNICRSPMAEYVLRHQLPADGSWAVSSAGVFAADGMPASASALEVLAEWGIDGTAHRSRMLTDERLAAADYVLVMTHAHREAILSQWPTEADKVFLLGAFGRGSYPQEIADPIGQSTATYRRVGGQLRDAVADFILYLVGKGELTSRNGGNKEA